MPTMAKNTNTNQTWDFNSALHNSAAKADFFSDDQSTITGADLLKNDPGSATFIGLYDATIGNGTAVGFLGGADGVNPQPTNVDLSGLLNTTHSIYEVIRTANGTFSLAPVY